MAKLLFKLNGVPDDEAEEIRDLLEQNEVDFYETSAGMWGLSFAGIWLKDEDQFNSAKALLEEYHQQRYENAVDQRRERQESGEAISWWRSVLNHPIKTTAVLIFVGAVLYLSIVPFFFGEF